MHALARARAHVLHKHGHAPVHAAHLLLAL